MQPPAGAAKQGGMRLLWLIFGLALTTVVVAAGAITWAHQTLHSPGPALPGGAILSVPRGAPFAEVVRSAEEDGLLRHGWLLRLYARHFELDRGIRSGDFRFDEALAPVDLLAALRSTQHVIQRVTLREGLNVRQVVRHLDAGGLGAADEYECLAGDAAFLADLGLPATGLEGYLFPDTYDFSWRDTPESIVRALVARFRKESAALAELRQARGMSESEMVTLAALIEKETGVAEERPRIAAVFHNRLRIGMRLQSDPTAIYPWKEGVPTAADVRTHTPYNTYTNDGLPPGPICNPGRDSMRAALQPAQADDLYFVSRGDGSHAFARTLTEHNRNVAALRRVRQGR